MELIWAVFVHSATLQDRSGAREFISRLLPFSKRLRVIWADMGYISRPLSKLSEERLGAKIEIKKHRWQGPQWVRVARGEKPPPPVVKPMGFVVLPKRWVVERTFAWLGWHRRHSKDYEHHPENTEAFVLWSMTRNMLRRLASSS